MNENVSTLESRSKSESPTGVAPACPGAWETCVVCGHSVEPGRGAARINHLGNTVNLCGPQCLRTFAGDPAPYLGRLARVMRERAWKTEPETA
jgi:ribosomal protein L24E